MRPRPPRSTWTVTPLPYTTLVRSRSVRACAGEMMVVQEPDLRLRQVGFGGRFRRVLQAQPFGERGVGLRGPGEQFAAAVAVEQRVQRGVEIGRASCRERVCQDG